MEYLPPFSTLLAFDAVARAGSFSKGAQRMNVTQPAISRRIAVLEADLGLPLFDRSTRPNRLTEAGQMLHQALRQGLNGIEQAVADLRRRSGGQTVTLSTGTGFASFWLGPRLGQLKAAFPEYEFRLLSGDGPWRWDEVDLRIEFGSGTWADADARKIIGEEVFAVCSPALAADLQNGLSALERTTLLEMRDPEMRWYSWRTWLAAVGHAPGTPLRIMEFDNYALLVSAALAGQGAALCWSGLLDPLLESGALVRVSDHTVRSEHGYHVLVPSRLGADAPARRIAAWLDSPGLSLPSR